MSMINYAKILLTNYVNRQKDNLQLDLNYWIRNGFWVGLKIFGDLLLDTIFFFFLVRLLPASGYGKYQFLMALLGLLSIFSMRGINTSILQATANGHPRSLVVGVKARIKYALIGSIVILCTSLYFYFIRVDFMLSYLLMFMAFLFPFLYSFDSAFSFLMGLEKFKLGTIYSNVLNFSIKLVLLMVLFLTRDVFWIMIIFVLLTSLFNLVVYLKCLSLIKGNSFDPETVSYGIKLSLLSVISIIGANIDKIILPFFLGLENLAIYSVAIIFPNMVIKILNQGIFTMLPRLTRISMSTLLAKSRRLILYYVVLSFAIIIPLILLIPYLVLFVNPEYSSSIIYSQIFATVIIFTTLKQVFFLMLKVKKKIKELTYVYVYPGIFRIVAIISLIYFFGIMGAVIALIVSQIFELIFILALVIKLSKNTNNL